MRLAVAALALVALGANHTSGYMRTRVEAGDPTARCLYWRSGPITWHQSVPGTGDLPDNEAFGGVQRSFGRWQSLMQQCGSVFLEEGARSNKRQIGFDPYASDNQNLVLFRDRDCEDVAPRLDPCWQRDNCGNRFDCWDYSSEVLALTTNTYDIKSGEIYDSDIEINTANHTFSVTNQPCSRVSERECICPPGQTCIQTDLENTMTHEVGHLVGLSHVNIPTSTMFATAVIGETQKREVDAASGDFICDAYPAGQPPKNCTLAPASDELGEVPKGCGSGGPLFGMALAGVLPWFARRRRG